MLERKPIYSSQEENAGLYPDEGSPNTDRLNYFFSQNPHRTPFDTRYLHLGNSQNACRLLLGHGTVKTQEDYLFFALRKLVQRLFQRAAFGYTVLNARIPDCIFQRRAIVANALLQRLHRRGSQIADCDLFFRDSRCFRKFGKPRFTPQLCFKLSTQRTQPRLQLLC